MTRGKASICQDVPCHNKNKAPENLPRQPNCSWRQERLLLTKHVLNFCFSLPVVGRTVPAQEILLNLVYCPLPQHFNYSFRYQGEKRRCEQWNAWGNTFPPPSPSSSSSSPRFLLPVPLSPVCHMPCERQARQEAGCTAGPSCSASHPTASSLPPPASPMVALRAAPAAVPFQESPPARSCCSSSGRCGMSTGAGGGLWHLADTPHGALQPLPPCKWYPVPPSNKTPEARAALSPEFTPWSLFSYQQNEEKQQRPKHALPQHLLNPAKQQDYK